jgi:putative oxidoreductase
VRDYCNEHAPLPLRVVFGGFLMYAGGRKLFLTEGHANIVHILKQLGVPFANFMGWIVGLIEFGGGLSLLLGFCTRKVAAINIVNLLANVLLAAIRGGYPQPLPGQQPLPDTLSSMLGIGGLVSLYMSGAGAPSVDQLVDAASDDDDAA